MRIFDFPFCETIVNCLHKHIFCHCLHYLICSIDIVNDTLPEELLASYSATPNRELEIISQNPKSIATETVAVPLKAKQVSFDIYHKAWMQFATTKPVSRCMHNVSIKSVIKTN